MHFRKEKGSKIFMNKKCKTLSYKKLSYFDKPIFITDGEIDVSSVSGVGGKTIVFDDVRKEVLLIDEIRKTQAKRRAILGFYQC